MSLLEAAKNLRDVARTLGNTKFNFNATKVKEFADKIDGQPVPEPDEDFRRALLKKFLSGANEFTLQERRHLPFIIYDSNVTQGGVERIWWQLDTENVRHLRTVVGVYLSNYDGSAKTEFLRQKLYGLPVERAGYSLRLKKNLTARENLFGEKRFTKTAELFSQRSSVNTVLDELGLQNFYKTSKFVQVALKHFFYYNKPLDVKLKILQELHADGNAYQNIFPTAADALIQRVAINGNFGKPICMEIFYRRLGDPRFGNGKIKWSGVSDASRKIFCNWLVEEDFSVFFEIVSKTTNDPRWELRKNFWWEYRYHITNTWVYFAGNARQIAARISNRNFGNLTNSNGNAAVFIFQIGRYIFSEWSNVGKVRVYSSANENFFFARPNNSIDGGFVRGIFKTPNKNFIVKEWIHVGAWQDRVSAWINRYC